MELSGSEVGASVGGIVSTAAYCYSAYNLTSNLDVMGTYGVVGGIAGIAGGAWKDCTCTGNVYVKNAQLDKVFLSQHAKVLGCLVPTWGKNSIDYDSIIGTGTFTIEYVDGTITHTNEQISNNYGGWAW